MYFNSCIVYANFTNDTIMISKTQFPRNSSLISGIRILLRVALVCEKGGRNVLDFLKDKKKRREAMLIFLLGMLTYFVLSGLFRFQPVRALLEFLSL